LLDVSSRCPSSSNSGPHGLNIAIYRRTPKPGRIFVESGPALVIRYLPIAIASVQRLTARFVSFISRTSMMGNSFSFAPRPARRGLGFPLFERRTPRTIGRFCTRSRGPLSGAQNVGAVPQPTYERVARKRRMQNPLIFERHLVLPGRSVFSIEQNSGCLVPFRVSTPAAYRRHNLLRFPPFPNAICSRIQKSLVSPWQHRYSTHAYTTHLHSPPFIRRGRAGRFVACHSASAASPDPFRREPRFRYLPITSFR
jgi:hypothetical protein